MPTTVNLKALCEDVASEPTDAGSTLVTKFVKITDEGVDNTTTFTLEQHAGGPGLFTPGSIYTIAFADQS